MKLGRVLAVAHKEWHEILRDRIYFLLAFILPPLLMLVFCYGISQDVENVPFAVVDYDRSVTSRDYAHHYIVSRYFDYRGHLGAVQDADRLLANGDAGLALVIPERFEARLFSGQPVAIQARSSPTCARSEVRIALAASAIDVRVARARLVPNSA